MTFKIPLWMMFSVLSMLMNGIWGALVELPEKRLYPPFPTTLGYVVWSLTFVPCALYMQYRHPANGPAEILKMLKPADCKVDKEKTLQWKAFLESQFGDILPIVIRTNNLECTSLTNRAVELIGMESLYTAMLDNPDEVHRLMAYLRDNALLIMRWAESEGLIMVNNGNQDSFGSSFNFTNCLPSPGYSGGSARLCDFWANTNSEETVGISPVMFREFCLPYYRDVCEPFGLMYYGCCEPIHPVWDCVKQLPHLKKISISRWCDQEFMSEALQGKDIVFSRKPDPRYLGVDASLDEDAWQAHIRETLKATRGVFTEFILRDIYTVHGNINKVRRGVELARKEIELHNY